MRAVLSDTHGFLGRRVAERLTAAGWEVRDASGADGSKALRALIRGADVAIDLSWSDPRDETAEASATASAALTAAAGKVGRYVLLSSSLVYDPNVLAHGPIDESTPVLEKDAPAPAGPLVEAEDRAARMGNGGAAVVLRVPLLYGRDAPAGIEALRTIMDGAGTAAGRGRVQWAHVEDVAQAVALAATGSGAGGRAFHVADPFGVPGAVLSEEVGRLWRLLTDTADPDDRVRPDYPMVPPLLSVDAATRTLGFAPQQDFWFGLAQMMQAIISERHPDIRARALGLHDEEAPLGGQVAVVTGATAGIGREVALQLGSLGATVVAVGRNASEGQRLAAEIASNGAGRGDFLQADLSRQTEVRRLAGEIAERFPQIHILINNAGAIFGQRELTDEGVEMTLAVNHLAPFLLTNLLAQPLLAGRARIVNVTSGSHRRGVLDFDDLDCRSHYDPFEAYCRSKLANVLFTYSLAERLEGSATTANVVDPGGVATDIGVRNQGLDPAVWQRLTAQALSPQQAARNLVDLAVQPRYAQANGVYFRQEQPAQSAPHTYDAALGDALWEASAAMTGLQ